MCMCLFVCMYVSLSLAGFLFLVLSPSPSLFPSLSLSVSVCLCLSLSVSVCLSVCLSVSFSFRPINLAWDVRKSTSPVKSSHRSLFLKNPVHNSYGHEQQHNHGDEPTSPRVLEFSSCSTPSTSKPSVAKSNAVVCEEGVREEAVSAEARAPVSSSAQKHQNGDAMRSHSKPLKSLPREGTTCSWADRVRGTTSSISDHNFAPLSPGVPASVMHSSSSKKSRHAHRRKDMSQSAKPSTTQRKRVDKVDSTTIRRDRVKNGEDCNRVQEEEEEEEEEEGWETVRRSRNRCSSRPNSGRKSGRAKSRAKVPHLTTDTPSQQFQTNHNTTSSSEQPQNVCTSPNGTCMSAGNGSESSSLDHNGTATCTSSLSPLDEDQPRAESTLVVADEHLDPEVSAGQHLGVCRLPLYLQENGVDGLLVLKESECSYYMYMSCTCSWLWG